MEIGFEPDNQSLKHLNLRKTNFYGSLAPLGNLSKLNFLDISYTKLDADIEFLPSSLETIIAEGIPEIEKKMKVEIGKTGSGKSTLCDLLTAKTSDSEKDKESSENTNKTKEIQIKELEQEFEVNQGKKSKITYRIIDTPSAFDIFSASSQKPLKTILEIFKVGVNQILFVIDGNFNQHDMNIYNFLRKETIFDQDIVNYVTIVRTNFNDFDNEEKCKEDIKKSVKKDSKLSELIELFQGRIIHVDNPSLEVKNKDELEFNKERRNKSRNKIVDHLNKNCQSVYKFKPKETIRDELISELRKIKDTTLAVLVITLERLFVIKDNTKKFVDK
ncbi:15276_t:CDS:2 [Funneliformis geosporum]|uniref:15276_t:CDS:1 n=1 Tax=Funneliformis geosporum TaxID=1117311 RepID=A0A9W4S9F8_9GLOM|nr:15276_t:CDS:2 [Funneliformis geosporum]